MSYFYPSENHPFPSKKKTKPKRHLRFALEEEMSFFNPALSSQFLTALPTSRTRSQKSLHPPDDIDDDFLSSDLEVSFASNVSLNSPPRDAIDLSAEYEPMDISPAPPRPKNSSRDRSAPSNGKLSRPRAFTTAARMFGRDVSNDVTSSISLAPSQSQKSEAIRQRGALPSEWLMVSRPSQATNNESLFESVVSFISVGVSF
jgi:M-phase inducer tyrosine phosphatase